jgi:hypothetical protein
MLTLVWRIPGQLGTHVSPSMDVAAAVCHEEEIHVGFYTFATGLSFYFCPVRIMTRP